MITTLIVLTVVAAAALLAVHAVAAFLLAETLTRTKRWRVEGDPRDMRLRHEEVTFAAVDGLALRGWYLESPGARATIVLVHDAEGTRSDPSLGLLEAAARLRAARPEGAELRPARARRVGRGPRPAGRRRRSPT